MLTIRTYIVLPLLAHWGEVLISHQLQSQDRILLSISLCFVGCYREKKNLDISTVAERARGTAALTAFCQSGRFFEPSSKAEMPVQGNLLSSYCILYSVYGSR